MESAKTEAVLFVLIPEKGTGGTGSFGVPQEGRNPVHTGSFRAPYMVCLPERVPKLLCMTSILRSCVLVVNAQTIMCCVFGVKQFFQMVFSPLVIFIRG